MEDEDIIMPDEEVSIPTETEESTGEVNQPEPTQEEPENEDKKVLDYLNSKGLIKFNGENVEIKDLNDLVTNYQKGLNYERLTQKENTVMDYIKGKASQMNISPEEYINRVKEYEKKKEQEEAEKNIQDLVNKGYDEEIARRLIKAELAQKE